MEIQSTEVQNNFGRYMKLAQFENIIVTKNGKRMVAIIPCDQLEGREASIAEKSEVYDWKSEKISFEDFLKLSEESDKRYEYIDGEVYLLSSPSYDHQSIIVEMLNIRYNWFKGKECRPLTAPFDVTLTRHGDRNVVQPDIIVICDLENVNDKRRYTGTPTLVVEVLSVMTGRKDMLKKLDLYMNSGIREYWIVKPFHREAYVYSFEEKDIRDYRTFKGNETIKSPLFDGLEVPLEQIFEVYGTSKAFNLSSFSPQKLK